MRLGKPDTAPLSLREKLGYGLGDMASNFYMGFFGIFLLYYYTDVWGIAPAAVGVMFLVTKVIDAFSDPAMGLLADRTESRWGKYRPYLLWVAVPYAALGYLLFLGPDLSQSGKLIFAYVSYSLVMLGYTAINVPYSALLAVISPVAIERTKATQFRFVFASLGTLVVSATTKPLVEWLGGGNEVLGFRLTIILFAILTVILFWITFASTEERIKPEKHNSSAADDMAVLFKNISWIVLAVSGILVVIGLISRVSSAAFYMKYNVAFGSEKIVWWMDRTSLLITLGFVGQLIGALLTPTFLRIFDKRQLMIFANILNAALLIGCYFVPPENYWMTVFFHSASIFCFGIIITLLFAMYTDCAEYGEWKSGKNSAGLTVSASMFSLKAGSAIGSAVPAFILAAFGFMANQTQTPESLQGIRIMFNFVPAIFFFIAGVLMVFYKLNGVTVNKMERELLARRSDTPAVK